LECFAGGAVVEAGGGVVAHGRRLQAAVLLFQTVEGEVTALPFSSVCLPLLSFSVVSLYPPGLLSSFLPRFKLFLPLRLSLSVVPFLFGSVLCFSLFPLLSVLSLFLIRSLLSLVCSLFGSLLFFLLSVLSLSGLLLPFPFSPFFFLFRSIYRAKGRGFLWLHMGSKGCGGWSAIWVQLSRFRSLFFG
jgi:hypothetical protein